MIRTFLFFRMKELKVRTMVIYCFLISLGDEDEMNHKLSKDQELLVEII